MDLSQLDLSGYSEKDQLDLLKFVEQESKRTDFNAVVSDFTGRKTL
jgi:hypothetical protein